jgi:hypothetical protein
MGDRDLHPAIVVLGEDDTLAFISAETQKRIKPDIVLDALSSGRYVVSHGNQGNYVVTPAEWVQKRFVEVR